MEKHVMQYQTVHFNLNGKDVERTVDVRASLTACSATTSG